MKPILISLLLSLILFNIGCTNSNTGIQAGKKPSSHQAELKPSDYHQRCQFLFHNDKQPIATTMVWDCLAETQPIIYPQLIDKLLSHKPMLSKKHLGTALAYIVNKKEAIEDISLLKKLLDAGAPTTYISLNNILISRSKVCKSVTLIIEHNLHLFQTPEYLNLLTQINRGYASCPEAIKLLVSNDPKLLDSQYHSEMTPLHNYLVGVDSAKWDLGIAKLLMTKKSIKIKDKKGYTPLHYIQLYTADNKALYDSLIQDVDKHLGGTTDKVVLQKSVDNLIIKNRPKCHDLVENKSLNQRNISECFTNYAELETPYLVNKLLDHKPPVSKKILTDLITLLANDMSNAIHTKSLKKLINAGASTDNVSPPRIIYGGDHSCNTIMLVLKNNSPLYKNEEFLKSKRTDGYSYPDQDLHGLSAVGMERGICPEAIQFLAKTHPHLRDALGRHSKSTPLHVYLTETHWPGWDLKTLKTLISKKNINLQDNYGNTPLHDLNSGSSTDQISEHEIRIIRTMIEHGADVRIKNKKGKSVQDLLAGKNPKLKALFSLKPKYPHYR